MDIKKFYIENKSDYYANKFNFSISLVDAFDIYDEEDAINEFKSMVEPYNCRKECDELYGEEKFIYLCNYLDQKGYVIKQYPNFLRRPTSRYDFSYVFVRNEIIKTTGSSPVAWSDRRIYVSKLEFIKEDKYNLSFELNKMIMNISTSNSEFRNMNDDEKLEAICNSIEYLLKEDNGFIKLNYEQYNGLISDEIIKKYRNEIQFYRHATAKDLEERASIKKDKKEFFIDYGVMIIKAINNTKKHCHE